jgi:hypothetical protein
MANDRNTNGTILNDRHAYVEPLWFEFNIHGEQGIGGENRQSNNFAVPADS